MLANATALSHSEGRVYEQVREQVAHLNTTRAAEGRANAVRYWPLAFIALGLVASVAWTAGLIYGAYLLLWWSFT